MKTGALIRASVVMAACCAPRLDPGQAEALAGFGATIGLAFQVQDDLLDVEGDTTVLGKRAGSDQSRGLPTYPVIAGLPATRARVRALHADARARLVSQGWGDSPLAELSDWLLGRRH